MIRDTTLNSSCTAYGLETSKEPDYHNPTKKQGNYDGRLYEEDAVITRYHGNDAKYNKTFSNRMFIAVDDSGNSKVVKSTQPLLPLGYREDLIKPILAEVPVLVVMPDPFATSLKFTVSQKKVRALVLKGLKNAQISEELGISVKAIKGHLTNVYKIEQVSNRLQLVYKYLYKEIVA